MAISRTLRRISITSLVFAACAIPGYSAEAEDAELKAGDVPAPVMATMQKAANGAKLDDFERENEDGKTVYTATFDAKDGKEMEITVNADGSLVSVEAEKAETDGKDEKGQHEGKDEKDEKDEKDDDKK